MQSSFTAKVALSAALLVLVGCGGGGGGGTSSGGGESTGLGTLRVSLTDAPSCGYAEVNVP